MPARSIAFLGLLLGLLLGVAPASGQHLPAENFWTNANREAGTTTAFAFSPAVPHNSTTTGGTLFVGTEGGGVWRSTDLGTNWFPTDLEGVPVRALALSERTGALYAATYGKGAFRSDDLGDDFDRVFEDPDDLLAIAINTHHPTYSSNDGDLFIGTDGRGIFFSDDDGRDWHDLTRNLPNGIVKAIAIKSSGAGDNRDRIFVGTEGRGVWYLDYNYGATRFREWKEANGAALGRANIHALVLDRYGKLYAGTDEGLFKSSDDGRSWTHVLSGFIVRSLHVFTCDSIEYVGIGSDGQYFHRARTVNTMGTVRSFDSGLQDRTVLALHFTGGKLFLGSQDHGVFRSDDCGETFSPVTDVSLQDAYRAVQALAFDERSHRLYAGTYGFGIIMSDDLGEPWMNWSRVNKGLGNFWVYAMALRQERYQTYLFAGTWGGGVYRSTDGGENWLFSGLPHRIVYDLAVTPSGLLYAATDRGEVARSVDNGRTWQEIGVAATAIWALGVDPDHENVIYAGTFGAGIYKSTDGGFTWQHTSLKTGHVFDFDFGDIPGTNDDPVFAATSSGVFYSDDQGYTWTDFSNGLAFTDVRAVAFAGDDLLAGTWGGGIFIFDPHEGRWIKDGLPNHAVTLFAVSETTGEVFVATDGGGLFRKAFGGTTTPIEDALGDELPKAFALEQNYPNPFNPQTKIAFDMPEAAPVRLIVFDALGRQVRTLTNGVLPAGRHEVVFEAGELPSGVYFYQLHSAGQVFNKKMILLK